MSIITVLQHWPPGLAVFHAFVEKLVASVKAN
jgi:hypothetical protein